MKILMVTPMPPQAQAAGAIPLVLHAELEGLLEHHRVSLVTIAGMEPGEQEAAERLIKSGLEIEVIKRTQPKGWERWQRRWQLVSTWTFRNYPWRTVWFYERQMQPILNQWLANRSFDLIIIEDNAMGVYTYQTTTPLLFTEHEVRRPRPINLSALHKDNIARWIIDEIDWRRWPKYERWVWRKFNRIQTFTPRDASAIASIAPELTPRVKVNPFGIEIPPPLRPENELENTILFVGNFTHPPNVDAALWLGNEIMPELRKIYDGAKLWLIGIYPPSEVKALACNDILVTGPVPEIEPYFSQAAVVAAPVRIGGGMRMKVLQAMALGKAIVSTSRGIDGLSVEGSQPPVEIAEDAFTFASSIANLLKDPAARHELGRRARIYVTDHYSSQAYASRIEKIYAEMIEERTSL